jgi:ABC-type antimicrobial peptide transport system permease subunit
MMTVLANGIPVVQTLLRLPTSSLRKNDSQYIPAIIGKAMSKSSRLKQGDVVTMRLKDHNGAFTAVDLEIVEIMNSPIASTDTNKIWLSLADLQNLKGTPEMASIIVIDESISRRIESENWNFVDDEILLKDLRDIKKTETGQQNILFALLLFLGMIAIFDTQILALFKRRKEIGMLNAMGMTRNQIVLLFTTEGVLYMIFSLFFTAVLGYPLFWYFAVHGYKMPEGFEEWGFAGFSEPILFEYPFKIILGTVLFVFVLTAFVSWLPSAKIAKMKPTDALRGKFK